MKQRVRSLFFWLLCCLGKIGLSTPPQSSRTPKRVLLLLPNPLGSMVFASPVIHALKSRLPDVHLTLLVTSATAELARYHPDIDEVLICRFPAISDGLLSSFRTFPQLVRMGRQLHLGHYDLGINLRRRFWWGSALLLFAHIPLRVGWFAPGAACFLTTTLPRPPRQHTAISMLTIANAGLQAAGLEELAKPYTPDRYPPLFEPTHEDYLWAKEFLMQEKITPETRLILIHPGTGGILKRWRTSSWTTTANQIHNALSDKVPVRFILTGGKSEFDLLEEIAPAISASVSIARTSTVGRLGALFQQVDLVLGVDSGPLHLAVAMGTRTVRIFGPTDPVTYGPWGSSKQHKVVTSTYRCEACPVSPCNRLRTPKEQLDQHICTKMVPVEAVLKSALEQMDDVIKVKSQMDVRKR